MQPHVDVLLALLTAQRGDRYVFGAEAAFTDPNPARWDCSELIEWGCHRVGVQPVMPDGASAQWAHCMAHKTVLAVRPGEAPRGALLFRLAPNGNHVAMTLGQQHGRTIEARGVAYGVNEYPIAGRLWTGVALIPGLDYRPPANPAQRLPAAGWYHRLLSLGSTGPDVVHVQQRIGARPDGDYGPKTRAALIRWQAQHHLVPDGVVGPKTAAALK